MLPVCSQRLTPLTRVLLDWKRMWSLIALEMYQYDCTSLYGSLGGGGKGPHLGLLLLFFQDKGHLLAGSPLFSCCSFLCGSRSVSQSFCTPSPGYCRCQSCLPNSEVPISRRDLSLWPKDELQELCRWFDLRMRRGDWEIRS